MAKRPLRQGVAGGYPTTHPVPRRQLRRQAPRQAGRRVAARRRQWTPATCPRTGGSRRHLLAATHERGSSPSHVIFSLAEAAAAAPRGGAAGGEGRRVCRAARPPRGSRIPRRRHRRRNTTRGGRAAEAYLSAAEATLSSPRARLACPVPRAASAAGRGRRTAPPQPRRETCLSESLADAAERELPEVEDVAPEVLLAARPQHRAVQRRLRRR